VFTGLIREVATIKSYKKNVLQIKCDYRPKIGDSIAINGICLTASKLNVDGFCLDVSDETIQQSTAGTFKSNQKIHIEPAMQLSDRLEGHILQGHIDAIGKIQKIQKINSSYNVFVTYPDKSKPFIAPKGSIAIDGVSLTINEVLKNTLRLTIIPHTFANTLFATYEIGTLVNMETDFFAKYIYHILQQNKIQKNKITWEEIDEINNGY